MELQKHLHMYLFDFLKQWLCALCKYRVQSLGHDYVSYNNNGFKPIYLKLNEMSVFVSVFLSVPDNNYAVCNFDCMSSDKMSFGYADCYPHSKYA